ncbi:hypothetical protein D3C73_995460 [compost metagenome]
MLEPTEAIRSATGVASGAPQVRSRPASGTPRLWASAEASAISLRSPGMTTRVSGRRRSIIFSTERAPTTISRTRTASSLEPCTTLRSSDETRSDRRGVLRFGS